MFKFFKSPILWQNATWLGFIFQAYLSLFGDKRIYEIFIEDLKAITLAILMTGLIFLSLNIVEIYYARKTNKLISQISDEFAVKLELTLMGVRDLLSKEKIQVLEMTEDSDFSDSDNSITPERDFTKMDLAHMYIIKYFNHILIEGEFDLSDALAKLSNDGPISIKIKTNFYKSLTFIILTYREKLLAEVSGRFASFGEIETDLNGTYSESASINRTSNKTGKAHENGPLRAATVITKNLISSYYQEMLPNPKPNFDFKNLAVKSLDGFKYEFTSYYALLTEIKTPASQDPKIRAFYTVLLKVRLEVARITARICDDYDIKICNGTFPLQHSIGGEIFHWTKIESFSSFYLKFLKSKICPVDRNLGIFSIASDILQKGGSSPFQSKTDSNLFESYAIMPEKNLPTFRAWKF